MISRELCAAAYTFISSVSSRSTGNSRQERGACEQERARPPRIKPESVLYGRERLLQMVFGEEMGYSWH